ncbi:HD domain-containing protein [Acholeplasma equirhinis]|uniref:HD domain-containing protein n=1 Tax=Acholeplasma equirhinis TaxID=555393 RepID=UPI00197AD27B|nr:HD domain-containing protein [Acholeplasma equirhinis]MBN3490842.1 HD domain-containing protein [Acholeplasma equirhinis]
MEKIIGKIESINKGPNYCNTTILLEDKKHLNIKLELGQDVLIQMGKIFQFEIESFLREEVTQYKAISIKPIDEVGIDSDRMAELVQAFYEHAPLKISEIKKGIESFLKKISNPVLKAVTEEVYKKYINQFYLHPAATKFHHAYFGGLSYHTYSMLKMIDPMVDIYPFLNRDLLYAATILHDVSKVDEMTGVDGEYTKEGQLLGHIVMGALEIDKAAVKLGLAESEEVMLLKHLMISHHGMLNFGSPKKPQTGEALLLWYIDSIDSKFTELGVALNSIEPGEFTQSINVLDKMRFYKPNLKNDKE